MIGEYDSTVAALLAAVIVMSAVVDVWLWSRDDWRGEWTISASVRRWAAAWWPLPLVVAFAAGLLIGHWFW